MAKQTFFTAILVAGTWLFLQAHTTIFIAKSVVAKLPCVSNEIAMCVL